MYGFAQELVGWTEKWDYLALLRVPSMIVPHGLSREVEPQRSEGRGDSEVVAHLRSLCAITR